MSYGMLSRTEYSIHLRGRNVIASLHTGSDRQWFRSLAGGFLQRLRCCVPDRATNKAESPRRALVTADVTG